MRILVGFSIFFVLSIFVQAALPGTGQTKQSLVGKWKVVKSQGEEGKDPGTMEFFKDGRIIIMEKNSAKKNGSYSLDDTTTPATILVKILINGSESNQKIIIDCPGIYRFEGKRLILKIVNAPKMATPKDFTVDTDGYSNLELVR